MPPATNIHRFTEWQTTFELGLTKVYKDELKKLPKTYAAWLKEERAKHFYDTEWNVSGLGVMPAKTIGGTFVTDQILQGSTKQFSLQTYGLSLLIQYEAYRWDLYGVFGTLTKKLAKSATDRYNLVAYSLLNNAFSTSDSTFTTFQGEAICDSSHTRLDGGTWRNRPTTNMGISYLGFQQAKIDLRKMVDERGRFTMIAPRQVIVPVETEWIAEEILKSKYRPDNNQMQYNSAGDYSMHSAPYITQTTYWFVLCNKDDYAIKMSLGDDPDFMTENVPGTRNRLYTSYCSFRLDVYNSVGIWGSSGDGATSS
jgi:hypothetical protein